MLQYFVEIYMTLFTYGFWVFAALAVTTIIGGVALLVTMADHAEKGSLDFNIEHMTKRKQEYSSLIVLWKKSLAAFVVIAFIAVFAPSKTVVHSWLGTDCKAIVAIK